MSQIALTCRGPHVFRVGASPVLLKNSVSLIRCSYREMPLLTLVRVLEFSFCTQYGYESEGCLSHSKQLLIINKKLPLLTFDHFSIINRAVSLRSFDCPGLHLRFQQCSNEKKAAEWRFIPHYLKRTLLNWWMSLRSATWCPLAAYARGR